MCVCPVFAEAADHHSGTGFPFGDLACFVSPLTNNTLVLLTPVQPVNHLSF